MTTLRVPGSFADSGFPAGRIPLASRLFRGTGTSQSAAVVSGEAALLLQRNPALTPDQVKGVLMATAVKLEGDPSVVQGAGQVNVRKAIELLEGGNAIPAYTQTMTRSTGRGTLEGARGGSHIADPTTSSLLTGEIDPFGVAWDSSTWAPKSTARTAWTAGTWRGTVWAGTGWSGSTWASVPWASRSWSGVLWSSRSWSSDDAWDRPDGVAASRAEAVRGGRNPAPTPQHCSRTFRLGR